MTLEFLIALAQLFDAYFRRLPFSKHEPEDLQKKIFVISAAWCVASIFLYEKFFANFGVNAATYKSIVMLGWLPYFLIALGLSGWRWLQNFFVLGMAAIFALTQHTLATSIVINNFGGTFDIIFFEATIYLLLFAISFPLSKNFFVKLLPSREFFDLRPQGIYIALLPLIIVSAHMIRIADDVLIHSWEERLSRIFLPPVFFFFYRYILSATKNFYDMQRLERNKILLEEKLSELKDYNALIEENRTRISVMRHDLRHSYNIIYTLLQNGETDKALEFIRAQKNFLEEKK